MVTDILKLCEDTVLYFWYCDTEKENVYIISLWNAFGQHTVKHDWHIQYSMKLIKFCWNNSVSRVFASVHCYICLILLKVGCYEWRMTWSEKQCILTFWCFPMYVSCSEHRFCRFPSPFNISQFSYFLYNSVANALRRWNGQHTIRTFSNM